MAGISSTPPEPGFGTRPETGTTPGQFAVQGAPGRRAGQPAIRRRSRPRIVCAIIWAAVAIVCGVGGILELTISNAGGAVVSFVVAVLSGWYVFRVWTFRARLLVLVLGSVREVPGRYPSS
jgi:hypothetical protein